MQNRKMTKPELKNRKEQIRAKHIRAFAKGVEVIPVNEQKDIFNAGKPRRIAIYPYISTDDMPRITSLEYQISNYEELLKDNPKMSETAEE